MGRAEYGWILAALLLVAVLLIWNGWRAWQRHSEEWDRAHPDDVSVTPTGTAGGAR